MEQIHGAFRKHGKVVGGDADIILMTDVSGPAPSWRGSFELPRDAPMLLTGSHELELQDGRVGDVEVTAIRRIPGVVVGLFTGHGSLHEPVI